VTESYDPDERDWRLQVELDVGNATHSLRDLVGRLRGPSIDRQIEERVSHDVVITHNGKLLFAYAAAEGTLRAARSAIEDVLRGDGVRASMRVSHWDERLDAWRQTDPPPTETEKTAEDAAERDAETVETRMLVASLGKAVRAEFEQSMRRWADELGIECEIVEHPHLLTSQAGFTVTGPKRKLDEFSQGLAAEEYATIRTERVVMLSPL
jgi:hypothetical protein